MSLYSVHPPDEEALVSPPVSVDEQVVVLGALYDLMANPDFKASERNRQFLRFVVEETLAGRADRIKSYAIAVDVFGRGEAFDPSRDPIVRIEAWRLRSALSAFYLGPGKNERVRFDIPKGRYVPQFAVAPKSSVIGAGSEMLRILPATLRGLRNWIGSRSGVFGARLSVRSPQTDSTRRHLMVHR